MSTEPQDLPEWLTTALARTYDPEETYEIVLHRYEIQNLISCLLVETDRIETLAEERGVPIAQHGYLKSLHITMIRFMDELADPEDWAEHDGPPARWRRHHGY